MTSTEPASCTVCLDPLPNGDRIRTLPCADSFHTSCINEWLTDHNTCPNCITTVIVPTVSVPLDADLLGAYNMVNTIDANPPPILTAPPERSSIRHVLIIYAIIVAIFMCILLLFSAISTDGYNQRYDPSSTNCTQIERCEQIECHLEPPPCLNCVSEFDDPDCPDTHKQEWLAEHQLKFGDWMRHFTSGSKVYESDGTKRPNGAPFFYIIVILQSCICIAFYIYTVPRRPDGAQTVPAPGGHVVIR